MKAGDWVYSYSKGIWQITSINEIESIFPNNSVYTKVHCKRFLNTSYKKSLSAESCSPFFIKSLPEDELQKINDIIEAQPKWYKEFLDYRKKVDSLLNLSFYVANKEAREELKRLISAELLDLDKGLTDVEIWSHLEKYDEVYKHFSIRNFTAQFVSPESEVKGKKLLYKTLNFLNF